jgi:hypothetical protein
MTELEGYDDFQSSRCVIFLTCCFVWLVQPVIYKEWGAFYMNKIKEHASPAQLVNFHLWVNEQGIREMGQQSVRLGKRVDKFTCVFNAKGFTPTLMRLGHGNLPQYYHILFHGRLYQAWIHVVPQGDSNHGPGSLPRATRPDCHRQCTKVCHLIRSLCSPFLVYLS